MGCPLPFLEFHVCCLSSRSSSAAAAMPRPPKRKSQVPSPRFQVQSPKSKVPSRNWKSGKVENWRTGPLRFQRPRSPFSHSTRCGACHQTHSAPARDPVDWQALVRRGVGGTRRRPRRPRLRAGLPPRTKDHRGRVPSPKSQVPSPNWQTGELANWGTGTLRRLPQRPRLGGGACRVLVGCGGEYGPHAHRVGIGQTGGSAGRAEPATALGATVRKACYCLASR